MTLAGLSQVVTWLDDRINPIVVKELRQAVRSRLVVVMLMVFLIGMVIVIGSYLLSADYENPDWYLGRTVFMILQSIVLGAGLLFVPMYTGTRLALERSPTNMALLYITTIRPRSIIAGKLLASAALTMMIYSICLPFLTITYLLRGIDVPTIFLIVALHGWIIFSAVIVAVFIASLPVGQIMQWLLGLGYLFALLMTFISTAVWAGSLAYEGAGSMIMDADFWTVVLLILFKTALAAGLLFAVSVAMISPAASNRDLGPRLYVSAAWLISLGGTLITCQLAPSTTDLILPFWIIEQVVVLSLGLLIVTCEPEQLGVRLQASLPRSKVKRLLAMPFYSGAGGGILWCATMMVLTLAIGQLLYEWGPGYRRTGTNRVLLTTMAALALYAYDYALTGLFLRRITGRKASTTIAWTLGLAIIGVIVPVVIAFLINPWRPNYSEGWWLLANPMGVVALWNDDDYKLKCLIVTACWAVIATMINGKWLIRQARQFLEQPPSPSTSETVS